MQVVTEMFKVETLQKENHIESRKLWEHAFPEDSADFLDAYYSTKGAANEIDVIRDDNGEICSMIQWNPVELTIGNQNRRIDYLVAVATRKDMRRKGLMATIMKAGLEKRKAQGMPFVFLTPANEAYYQPLGFKTVGQSYQCQLKDVPVQRNQYEVRIFKEEEYHKAAQWTNACLGKQYRLFATRSKRYFTILQKELASEGGAVAGVFCGDELKGTFVYTKTDEVEIREPVCETEDIPNVYGAIKEFFRENAEQALILACHKEIKNAIVGAKTMVYELRTQECKGIFEEVYLNEIV